MLPVLWHRQRGQAGVIGAKELPGTTKGARRHAGHATLSWAVNNRWLQVSEYL